MASSSNNVRTARPRSAGGALGGFIGAIIMSVVAGLLVTVAVTPVIAISGMTARSAIDIFENLPSHLNPGQLAQPSTLYAKKGKKKVAIASFFVQNRETVKLDQISQYVKDAAVAGEDPRFYTHGGVDIMGVGRAALARVVGKDAGGASTITMQYVRNVLIQEALAIPDEKEQLAAYKAAMAETADRKLKEMRYALSIEKKYSKDEILLGYLNIALFGRNIYGIESASKYYFGKHAKDVTLPEAASLIAIVNWPTKLQLDIPENIPANKERRDYILGKMLKYGKITQAQHDEAVATPVEPKITPRYSGCSVAEDRYSLGHFCDYVQRTILHDPSFGNTAKEREFNFTRGGLKIMTTIDLDLQNAGRKAMKDQVPTKMTGIDIGSAITSVEVGTGRVLTMVQNRPFSDVESFVKQQKKKGKIYTSINYNTDYDYGGSSGFQVGSTFKPITLAEWLRTGHSIRDIVNVNGRTIDGNTLAAKCLPGGVYGGSFTFSNDNLGVRGNQSVLTAIAQSLNGGVVSMQQKLDLCDTIRMAQDLGIHRASPQPVWQEADYKAGLISKSEIGKIKVPTLDSKPSDLTMVPSNTYGGIDEIAPLTMASAYAAFAGKGILCTPTPIDSITGPDGKDVPFTKSKCKQAISPEVAAGVAYVLNYTSNNTSFVRHTISAYGVPHLAKTGTTDDVIDHWTVGASTKVSTAAWVGNAGPTCYKDASGKKICDRVSMLKFCSYCGIMNAVQVTWPAVMNAADKKYGGSDFPAPDPTALKQTMARVPNVDGLPFDEAKMKLTAAGFGVADGGEKDSSVAKGLVASTDPPGGSSVAAGSTITIYRSSGTMTELPDVTGQSYDSALQALNGAGFGSVVGQCVGGKGNPKGGDTVVSMSPRGGKDARRNSQITLTVQCK